MPPFFIYAFMALTGKTLPFDFALIFRCQIMQLGRHCVTGVFWQTESAVVSSNRVYKDVCLHLTPLGKSVIVHATQEYGRRETATYFLDLETRWRWLVNFRSQRHYPLRNLFRVTIGWSPEMPERFGRDTDFKHLSEWMHFSYTQMQLIKVTVNLPLWNFVMARKH
jgi:hypothetical protein